MWLFKKSGKPEDKLSPSVSDKVANRIAHTGLRFQSRVSDVVNNRMKNVSTSRLKVLLALFSFCAGGYSIYLAAEAIRSPQSIQTLKIESVRVPRHVNDNTDELLPPNQYVDEQTYRQIRGFRHFMDSMKVNQPAIYDSIINARPGLMDSAIVLEELYRRQQ